MPPAAAAAATAAIGAIATAGSIGAVTFLGLTGVSAVLAIAVSNFALSALTSSFGSKPKTSAPNFQSLAVQSTNRTQQIRQPITARRTIYGEVRVSGPVVFAASTSGNKYLHLVIVLAAHEVASINEVWFNDTVIPNDALDGSGNVTSGTYSGKARIKKHLGTADQSADSDLVSAVSDWTSNHRLRGHAYIYVRLEFDRDKFPGGAPNISAVVQGKKILDPRDSVTRWSPNVALMGHDYLLDDTDGVGASSGDVDSDATATAANACEEAVTTTNLDATISSINTSTDIITLSGNILQFQRGDTVRVFTAGSLPGGLSSGTDYYVIPYQFGGTPRIKLAASLDDAIAGTAVDISSAGSGTVTVRKIAEPRYFGGGVIDSDAVLGENLRDIISGMGGRVVNTGGEWKLLAAIYSSPSVTFDEGHFRAALQAKCNSGLDDLFNTVKGIYVSPANYWQPADYPVVTNSTYKANDNGVELIADLDLPFTQRPHTAQRLAKIKLEQARQEIVVNAPVMLHGLQFRPGDTMNLDNTRLGWSGKAFEVQRWKMALDNDGLIPGVDMVLQETAAAVYDWNSGEETAVDPAPNTNLPDPFTVDVVTGFSLDSEAIITLEGDLTWKVTASWAAHSNLFVLSGGHFEIEYKKSSQSVYKSAGKVDGTVTEMEIPQLAPDTAYDFRIFAFNKLGARSAASEITGFVAGATVATATEDWENETTARDPDDWEADTEPSEDWES